MYGLTPYPITPIASFLGVVLAFLPLVSQIRKLSPAVWGYAFWIAVVNFQTFVNSIIWHDNVNIVVPIWCDIVTKLQTGAGIGTSACALVICLRLYRTTSLRASVKTTEQQRRKAMFFDLLLMIGLPIIVMALYIIVQPVRFEIIEEFGCASTIYSYVGYIIYYCPQVIVCSACAILAPLTMRAFLRHRKEMNEFLSTRADFTHNKYNRLMVIACLDTLINLPVLGTIFVTNILRGKSIALNDPYVSWKHVHDGAGEDIPGISLSSILQVPASAWNTSAWSVFTVKWDEWLYVLYAVAFFSVFGTTPEMRQYYRSAFWFIPERCGYKRKRVSDIETLSDAAFNSNPGQQVGNPSMANSSSSFLEATIETSSTYSWGMVKGNDLESGLTSIETHPTIESMNADEGQMASGT